MSATIDAGGLRVRYDLSGDASKPVVALCHSLGTNGDLWDVHAERFAESFRVLRFDLRGHGGTEVTPGPYTIELLAKDYLALLDALAIPRAHFCGVSLGGFVGQWLGANAAGRVDKLVLSNTAPVVGPPSIWQERIALSRRTGMRAVALGALERWFTRDFLDREPALASRTQGMLIGTAVEGYVAACAAIREMDLRTLVPLISRPTLVIAGLHDAVTPPQDAAWMAATIPGARLVTLEAAHLANVEMADAYISAVLSFLSF